MGIINMTAAHQTHRSSTFFKHGRGPTCPLNFIRSRYQRIRKLLHPLLGQPDHRPGNGYHAQSA